MPVRYVLVYQDQRVPLHEGAVIIGRSMACHVRFNAPTVSRQHLILHVKGEAVTAENLSSSTGTLLNGQRLTEPRPVLPGDELTLGPRVVRLERADPRAATTPVPQAALGLLPDGEDDEITLTEEVPPAGAPIHTCPSCRATVGFDRSTCPGCGHVWSAVHPSAVVGQVTSRNVHEDLPMPAEVLAIYSSDAMTIDVTLHEIRRDGAFVPTELLDAPGTECELTLLPDGQAPLMIRGAVTSARSEASGRGAAGIEVRFGSMSEGTRLWLELWVRRRERAAAPA